MLGLARTLPQVPAMLARLDQWPGDLAADAVIFRLNAGLHALALSGRAPGLAGLYADAPGHAPPSPATLDRALARALTYHADMLAQWLAHPTQTNEVARAAGLVAALMALNADAPMPCELLEIGASAGLNLNLAHYACRIGNVAAMAPRSPVMLAPEWRGHGVPDRPVALTRAVGVDINPLDVRHESDRERLEAFVWPGEQARSARLRAAIGIAQRHPPLVERGRASHWLARELAAPQPAGVRRVVFHAMVLQYADPAERRSVEAALAEAGARADATRPLVRIGIEWRADRQVVELTITRWGEPDANDMPAVAAHCHPYGEWFDWHGLAAAPCHTGARI